MKYIVIQQKCLKQLIKYMINNTITTKQCQNHGLAYVKNLLHVKK